MKSKCSICGKEFDEKVGMSPLTGTLAIRVRNRVGNFCPPCESTLRESKAGRRRIFFREAKVALRCAVFLGGVVCVFALFTLALAFSL